MNSLLKLPGSSLLTQTIKNSLPMLSSVRTKKVKSGASATNRRRTTPGKFRRLYIKDGDYVLPDELLVRQLGLQFYPGENVIFCENHSLKARFEGHVLITMEKLSPFPDSPLYPYIAAGNIVERKFIHVIPKKQEGTYKFVESF